MTKHLSIIIDNGKEGEDKEILEIFCARSKRFLFVDVLLVCNDYDVDKGKCYELGASYCKDDPSGWCQIVKDTITALVMEQTDKCRGKLSEFQQGEGAWMYKLDESDFTRI